MVVSMDQEERERYQAAIAVGVKQAKREGTTLSHVHWDGEHMQMGFTRPVPKEGLELIAERSTLPEGFELRHKRKRRGIVQTELPL